MEKDIRLIYRKIQLTKQRLREAIKTLECLCETVEPMNDSQFSYLPNAIPHIEDSIHMLNYVQRQMREKDKKGV